MGRAVRSRPPGGRPSLEPTRLAASPVRCCSKLPKWMPSPGGSGLFAKTGGRIKKVDTDCVLALLLSPALVIGTTSPSLPISDTVSVSLRDCGQRALQQFLATEPRYSLLRWEWGGRGEEKQQDAISLSLSGSSSPEGRHHLRVCGGCPVSSQGGQDGD